MDEQTRVTIKPHLIGLSCTSLPLSLSSDTECAMCAALVYAYKAQNNEAAPVNGLCQGCDHLDMITQTDSTTLFLNGKASYTQPVLRKLAAIQACDSSAGSNRG